MPTLALSVRANIRWDVVTDIKTEGVNCQICGCPVEDGEIVYCTCCFTPHHRDCWEYNSGCAVFACCGKVSSTTPTPKDCYGLPVAVDVADIPEEGTPTNLAHRITRLDLNTPLEIAVVIGLVLSLMAALVIPLATGGTFAAVFFPLLTVVMGFIVTSTDCTYVLDNEKRSIDFVRNFLGKRTRYTVCNFEEIKAVFVRSKEVSSKGQTWLVYATTIELADGTHVKLIDSSRNKQSIELHARALASHLGTPFQGEDDEGIFIE